MTAACAFYGDITSMRARNEHGSSSYLEAAAHGLGVVGLERPMVSPADVQGRHVVGT